MYTRKEFDSMVMFELQTVLGEIYDISLYSAKKNNGVERQGVRVQRHSAKIGPVIYLEEYYQEYINGKSLEKLVESIVNSLETADTTAIERCGLIDFDRFDCIKDRITYKVINFSMNEELLNEVPYVKCMDLAIVFSIVIMQGDNTGTSSVLIRNEHLVLWGTTVHNLYGIATKNTKKMFPYKFKRIQEIMQELEDDGLLGAVDNNVVVEYEMYVLSNEYGMNGAIAMLYEGALEEIAAELNSDLVVLPSSIHECMVIKANFEVLDVECAKRMVSDINASHVAAEEVLSNQIYYFERQNGELRLL